MNFSVSSKDLKSAVEKVFTVVPDKPNVPILKNILIKPEANFVTFEATDFSTAAAVRVPAEVYEKGSAAVTGKVLAQVVSKLAGDTVNFANNDNTVELESDSAEFSLRTDNADEFPATVFDSEFLAEIAFSSANFKNLVSKTTFAVAGNKDSRPIFQGVNFAVTRDKITTVATNSHRLAVNNIEDSFSVISLPDDEYKGIIPATFLNSTSKVLPDGETVTLRLNEKNCLIECADFKNQSRLIDGIFPPHEKILNVDVTCTAKVNRKELLAALERQNVIARLTEYHTVHMEVTAERIKLSAASYEVGKSSGMVTADVEGSINIAFNIDYLLDLFKSVGAEEFIFEFGANNLSPALVKAFGDDKFIYVVTPVRTQ